MYRTFNPTAEPNFSYIGIGTNIGSSDEKLAHIRRSINFLTEAPHTTLLKTSSVYESQPWGITDQPAFYNLVLLIKTNLTPYQLLIFLKDIEKKTGRTDTYRWGPRIIDLDILLYGNQTVETVDLKIPHRYFLERDFTVIPLLEITPDATLPNGELIKEKATNEKSTLIKLGELKRK